MKLSTIAVSMLGLLLASTSWPATVLVQITKAPNPMFDPMELSIQEGDSVVWLNKDTANHTSTSGAPWGTPDGSWNLTPIAKNGGMSPSQFFATAGDHPYYCDFHSNMVGMIHVLPAATSKIVTITGMAFSPADVVVDVGDTVIWRNEDSMDHTTTSGSPWGTPDAKWDSKNMWKPPVAGMTGASFAHTFVASGSYPYYCDYHSNMSAVVTVNGATSTAQILKAVKQVDGTDGKDNVVLSWGPGGSGPYQVLRGTAADLSDLAAFGPALGTTTSSDADAVPPPPSRYNYQVQ